MSSQLDDTLSLPIILAWIRHNLRKIIGGGIVLALASLPIVCLKAKTYESTTTLLVFPPTFKDSAVPNKDNDSISTMTPKTLPMEVYKALALSPPVLKEVIDKVPLPNTGIQTLEGQLEVELIQMGGRGAAGVVYTKAVMFHAHSSNPESAAKLVQTWAEVFKEQVDALTAKGVKETYALLGSLHENTKSELERADLALAEHRKAWNLDLIKAQLDAKQKTYTGFESTLKQTEVDIASGESKLKGLEDELAKEPQKLVYFRAPSDDAYWITTLQNGGTPKVQPDQGLKSEESNENYVAVRTLVVTAKGDLDGLKAQKDATLQKLDELKKEIDALTATFSDKTVERDKLTREADSLKTSYTLVRAEYEKGRMADQTQASDIVIAGNAVAPRLPSGPGGSKVVILAALLGMFATGGFLLLKDISELAPPIGALRTSAETTRNNAVQSAAAPQTSVDTTRGQGDTEKPAYKSSLPKPCGVGLRAIRHRANRGCVNWRKRRGSR